MEYKICIPLPPITKKNHQQIVKARGHYMVIPSKQYRDYEKACGMFLKDFPQTLNGELEITCVYYMPTRRRVDLTNLLEATHDILTHYLIIEDDNSNIIKSVDGSRVFYDKDNPRTEITIRELFK